MKTAKKIDYIHLSDYIAWGDSNLVTKELSHISNLDLFYNEGRFFNFAISENNYEICKSLIDYFENKLFPVKNDVYEEAKEKLTEILENAIDGVEVSKETQEVLSPYINFDNSFEDRLNDSFLNEINLPVEFERDKVFDEKNGNNTILTEEVLNDFQEQIKIVDKSSPTYTGSTHDNQHDNDNQEVKIAGDHDTDNS